MLNTLLNIFRRPQKINIAAAFIFAVAVTIVFYLSVDARYNQLEVWEQYPGTFFASGTPMMTTLDAYKFTRHAKEYGEGTLDTKSTDPMVFYPDGIGYQDPVPLLSVILDKISAISGLDLYHTGTAIIPYLSSLFIIPIALYFFFGGYPAAGVIAGLIGTFAPMYYGRTSMGRLDTDGLNVFFIAAASFFTMLAAKMKKPWQIYTFSALSGITINLFYIWYQHGVFNVMYLLLLIVCLAFSRIKIKHIAIAAIIFLVCSNPLYMFKAFEQIYRLVNVYLFPLDSELMNIFPNVYETIGEAKKDSIIESLSAVVQQPELAALGLLFFVVFGLSNFKFALPLAPLFLMGMVTFISAGRFSMFLGPIVGIGFGYAATIAGSKATDLVKDYRNDRKNKKLLIPTVAYSLLFFAVCVAAGAAMTQVSTRAFASVPAPSIKTPVYQMFKDMKTELPENSVIYTWWDYGLAIADVTDFPVFHSGTSQDSPKTWIIAKSLTGTQEQLYNIASYLDNFGINDFKDMAKEYKSAEKIAEVVEAYDKGPKNDGDYILFTDDMVGKFYPMSYLATWDPVTKKSNGDYFMKLQCSGLQNNILQCSGAEINLKSGIINGGAAMLTQTIFTEKGIEKDKIAYGFSKGNTLIMDLDNDTIQGVYIFSNELANTAFVQLYFLNKPNPEYFTPVMDRYPYGRLFKVNKKNG